MLISVMMSYKMEIGIVHQDPLEDYSLASSGVAKPGPGRQRLETVEHRIFVA